MPVVHDALAHHVAKWLAREPEMRFAEVFCPPAGKLRFHAWGALLHELREAVFELGEARVSDAKRMWWADEFAALASGRPRHPLTDSLSGTDASWSGLAQSLAGFRATEGRAGDASEAIALWRPLAESVVTVEAQLFGTASDSNTATSLVVHWLLHRLPHGLQAEDRAGLPLQLLARHGVGIEDVVAGRGRALLRDWAVQLLAHSPEGPVPMAMIRRARHGFYRARLRRLKASGDFSEPSAFASLFRAWSAARSRPGPKGAG